MLVSFPITHRIRLIMPWPIAVLLVPLAAGLWVVGLTVDAIRWVWTRRGRRSTSADGVRITIQR